MNIRTAFVIVVDLDGNPGYLATYRAFHRFGQAKIANGDLVLGSSRFSVLPQLSQKMTLASKVVKIYSKIVILLC